jgi:hypothetical protein
LIAALTVEKRSDAQRIKQRHVIEVTAATRIAEVAIVAEVSRKQQAKVRSTVRALE